MTYEKKIEEHQPLPGPTFAELRSETEKYRKALKLIDTALSEWGYDCADSDNSFTYYVSGVIEAIKDWSEDE